MCHTLKYGMIVAHDDLEHAAIDQICQAMKTRLFNNYVCENEEKLLTDLESFG